MNLEKAFRTYSEFMKVRYKVENNLENNHYIVSDTRSLVELLKRFSSKLGISLDTPATVGIDITSTCNANCIQCFHAGVEKEKKELSIDEWISLIRELKYNGVSYFYITGGEPFLREDKLRAIISEIKRERGLRLEIFSNGTRISNDFINFVRELLEPHDLIQISIDGPNAELHNKQRPGADFDLIVDNIKKLVNAGIKTRVNCTVTSLNFDKMVDIYDLVKSIGVHVLNFSPTFPLRKGKDYIVNDYNKLIIEFAKLIEENEFTGFPYLGVDPLPIMAYAAKDLRKYIKILDFPEYTHYCPAGKTIAEVNAYGEVYACYFLHGSELSAGNIRERPFMDIWQDENSWYGLRHRDLSKVYCNKCEYHDNCLGNCPAAAYLEYGTYSAPDPRCEIGTKHFQKHQFIHELI